MKKIFWCIAVCLLVSACNNPIGPKKTIIPDHPAPVPAAK